MSPIEVFNTLRELIMNEVKTLPTVEPHSLSSALTQNLADTYGLLLKTQNFHWNVEGLQFFALHGAFETQYQELFAAVDEIAERIRTLGFKVDAGLGSFAERSRVKDGGADLTAEQMIGALVDAYETANHGLRDTLELATDDEGTLALVGERLAAQEKTQWMLRAFLGSR